MDFVDKVKSAVSKRSRDDKKQKGDDETVESKQGGDDCKQKSSGSNRRRFRAAKHRSDREEEEEDSACLPEGELERLTSSGMVIRSMRTWNIKMPPAKKRMVGGRLVTLPSSLLSFKKKTRRVTIEIHRPPRTGSDQGESSKNVKTTKKKNNGKPCRGALRSRFQLFAEKSLHSTDFDGGLYLENVDDTVLRILKPIRQTKNPSDSDGRHDEDSIASKSDVSEKSQGTLAKFFAPRSEDHEFWENWKESLSLKLEVVQILQVEGPVVEMKLGGGQFTQVRDLVFESHRDARAFKSSLERMKELVSVRAEAQLDRYQEKEGGEAPGKVIDTTCAEKKINILLEIVSAQDLPIADLLSSDPYVVVRFGGKEIHRTDVISKNLDPIWTLDTGSLFLVQMIPKDFFACTGGMVFTVCDYDAIGRDEPLGRTTVKLDDLLNGKGERLSRELVPLKKSPKRKDGKKGTLNLRFRPATQEDIDFMAVYHSSSRKVGVYSDETYTPITPPDYSLFKRQTKKEKDGRKLYRVKPYPDPARPGEKQDEAVFMTKEQLQEEATKPSTRWIEAGSGDLGRLYFELIGCDDLPNMDATTLNVRDKTDAFAAVMFEDTVMMTDVIANTLSPRWMPWSRRAYAFNVSHPSSDLYVGFFDHDPEYSPVQMVWRATSALHDPIGRIVIELSRFLPNTEYTLTYPIYYGELAEERQKARGTVTLRLRLDWKDPRQALVRALKPSPFNYVTVKKVVDFQVAHYTANGAHDSTEFDMTCFTRYIEEVQSYERLLPYMREAFLTVVFWRGHYSVTVSGKKVYLPLHSMVAFAWGVACTTNFNLVPSFFVFSIGWLLLACNEYFRFTPSKWHRPRRYSSFLRLLLFQFTMTQTIGPNEDMDIIEEFNEKRDKYEKRLQEERDRLLEQESEIVKMLGGDVDSANDEDIGIATKRGGIFRDLSVNPLKPVLHPIQLQLRSIVLYLRFATHVLTWSETYISFWIVTSSFVTAIAIIWVPWGWVLRWLVRIVVWVVLGPWMKIVDTWYLMANKDLSEHEVEEMIRKRLRDQYTEALVLATNYQIRKERAAKLKALKEYMFGKYVVSVPRFREDPCDDIPLPVSTAKPLYSKYAPPVHIVERKYGQMLSGDMIPQRETQAVESTRASSREEPNTKFRFWNKQKSQEATPLLNTTPTMNECSYSAVSPLSDDCFANALDVNGSADTVDEDKKKD